jgi:hypothetical protein
MKLEEIQKEIEYHEQIQVKSLRRLNILYELMRKNFNCCRRCKKYNNKEDLRYLTDQELENCETTSNDSCDPGYLEEELYCKSCIKLI